MATYGPRRRINLDFSGATFDIAQHPSAGVAKVGARMARYVLQGVMSPDEMASYKPTPDELDEQVAVTAASHRMAGVYGIPRGALQHSVPFAFEGLVLGGLVQTGAEFSSGEQGLVVPTIDVPTTEQRQRFGELAADTGKFTSFAQALGNMTAAMANPMGPAQDSIETYHNELTEVSGRYAGDPTNTARFGELGEVRDRLAVGLRPVLLDSLPSGIGDTTGQVLVENVVRHTPSDVLLAAHFPRPQQ